MKYFITLFSTVLIICNISCKKETLVMDQVADSLARATVPVVVPTTGITDMEIKY
jgi:hypothetical protein